MPKKPTKFKIKDKDLEFGTLVDKPTLKGRAKQARRKLERGGAVLLGQPKAKRRKMVGAELSPGERKRKMADASKVRLDKRKRKK